MDGRTLTLPFIHLNLRRNPFGEPHHSDRADLAVVKPEQLTRWRERLQQGRFAIQFLGDAGHGKSTHLAALHAVFPKAPFTYVPEEGRPDIPSVLAGLPYFVDELQRLPKRPRSRIFSNAHAIVAGSHTDLTAELERSGLAVETVRLTGQSPEALRQILQARIEWARRSPGPVPTIPETTIRTLLQTCVGDVRAMEALLYERFQALKEIGDVEM